MKNIILITILIVVVLFLSKIAQSTPKEEAWNAYKNYKDYFSLSYPPHLTILSYMWSLHDPSIAFMKHEDGGALINVRVVQNKEYDGEHMKKDFVSKINSEYVSEGNVIIDGLSGEVFHLKNSETSEEYPGEKIVRVKKDEKIYYITSREIDYKKLWENFKFLD